MTIDELARRLHQINVLHSTSNHRKAMQALSALIKELEGSHLSVDYRTVGETSGEYILHDTLLFDREPEEG